VPLCDATLDNGCMYVLPKVRHTVCAFILGTADR
jgi:hypothetical protein